MTFAVIVSICLISTTIQTTLQLECGYNEVETKCPRVCSSEYCPTSDGPVGVCETPKKCGEPKCKCRFNTRRATNGTCIDTAKCPPFECKGQNEKYNACPPLCPKDDCSQATPEGICPIFGIIGTVVECTPRCRCITGYWRKNGVCVPYEQCKTY